MLLLLGLKTVLRGLPERMATCQYCQQFVQHRLQERATKFTLFFIPVFTTSRAFTSPAPTADRTRSSSRGRKTRSWARKAGAASAGLREPVFRVMASGPDRH